MFEVTVTYKNDYTNQKFTILPRIGDRIELQPHEKFPEFDTLSQYRVIDVLIFAGDLNETETVAAQLYVEKIAKN